MFIEIEEYQIYYKFINGYNKPLIVFLHEGLGSVAQWKNFPENVCNQSGYSALLYDRVGHGLSSALTKARQTDYMHIEAWQFLPQILEKLNITSEIILVGHSDGATIALLYASKFAQRVKAVVSIAAHVFVEVCTVQGVAETKKLYEEFDLKYLLEKYHLSNTDTMFYAWADAWLSAEFKKWNIKNDIREIKAPCLLIQGENDEYASFQQIIEIENAVSCQVEKLIIPSCGHQPHFQHNSVVVNAINSFLANYG